ncbi:MAG: Putative diheme cytochrome c-553 [uncultured Paraburkholderia sp.]|nr:MAG: Putative diheme cytochrome c-553 [uncultured Paraburkholderia sp.]CAH2945249.1 MAG: Putative diheme cytochrome c-553 [uncultured Paraburkholderia sp.]
MASPFGTIYSSNITPDPNAGIGRYTYDDFAKALREGVAPGGKRLSGDAISVVREDRR